MPKTDFPRVLPEPAHSMIFQFREDLFATYALIREKYQVQIDEVFDRVSREVGFVVTTTLPYTIEMGDGRIKGIIIVDGLQGTLFDRALTPVIELLIDDPIPIKTKAGSHKLYVFWYEALKFRLGTDWVEPAHFRGEIIAKRPQREVMWDVREPAHWFDSRIAIDREEAVLISVIDEVYPELRLADRVGYYRHGMGRTA